MKKQKELLSQIQQYDFALQEASLYLNAYPKDGEALAYYHQYEAMSKQAKQQYEAAYGPLTNRNNSGDRWTYVYAPWPWEKEDNYVGL